MSTPRRPVDMASARNRTPSGEAKAGRASGAGIRATVAAPSATARGPIDRSDSMAEKPKTAPGSRTSPGSPDSWRSSLHSRCTRPSTTTKTSAVGLARHSGMSAPSSNAPPAPRATSSSASGPSESKAGLGQERREIGRLHADMLPQRRTQGIPGDANERRAADLTCTRGYSSARWCRVPRFETPDSLLQPVREFVEAHHRTRSQNPVGNAACKISDRHSAARYDRRRIR